MADQILFEPRASNAKLSQDLSAMDSLVTARVRDLNAKLATAGSTGGSSNFLKSFSAANSTFGQFQSQVAKTQNSVNALDRSLSRMTSTMSGGLGIGIAIGGLALLERAFDKSINKAKEFQTAQLGIAASLASAYTLQGPSGQISGGAAFARAQGDASKLNKEIIERQAKNILTYQEQLGAFQSSVVAGAQKGFSPEQTLRVSEQLAIVAKTLGLHGEEIANASRIALGGATNVSRSTIGRALGITNEDIKSRSGNDLEKFLMDRTKGFQLAAPAFKDSIEGVLSTLQAKVDVFASHVGQKFFSMAQPLIKGFGDALSGQDADKYATMLANVFNAALKALQAIATSPAIPLLSRFLEFLGGYGDKILLAAVFLKIANAVNSTLGGLAAFRNNLLGIAEAASIAEKAETGLVTATEAVAASGGGGGSLGPRAALAEGGAAGAAWVPWAARSNEFRSERYGQIREEVGNVAPLPAGWVEQEGGRAFSSAFSESAVRMRARELEAAEQRKFNRNTARESYSNWENMMSVAPGTSEDFAKYAEQDAAEKAAAAESRRVARRQAFGNLGKNLIGRAQNGLMAAGLAYAGTDIARGYTDQYTGETAGAGLQGGIVAGAGLLGAGVATGPALAIAAAVGSAVALDHAFKELEDQVRKANEGFQEMAEKYPLAARIAQRNSDLSQMVGSGNLTPKTIEGLRKKTMEENALDFEAGQATAERDTRKNDLQSAIQTLTEQQKGFELGYGGVNADNLARFKGGFDQKQIDLLEASGQLHVTDSQKAQAKTLFDQQEAARDAWREQQRVSRIDKGLPEEQMPSSLRQYYTLEDTEQAFAGGDFRQQNLIRQMDENAKRQYTKEGLLAGLNPDKLGGQYDKGRAENELSIIGNRNAFGGPNAEKDYEEFATKMRQKFEDDFGLPLKRLEARMEGLHLGVSGENVAEEANLAYKITSQKLQDLADQWEITQGEADKLKIQAGAQRTAQIRADQYSKANQSYGSDSAGRILGKEASEEMVNNFKKAGLLSADNKYLAEAYDRRGDIESKRGELGFGDFARYQATAGAEMVKEMRLGYQQDAKELRDRQISATEENRQFQRLAEREPLREQRAQLNVDEAQLNLTRASQNPAQLARNTQSAQLAYRKAELAPTLETGEGPFSQVASAIRFGIDAQRGFDADKYAAAYRESIKIKEQEAEIAKQNLAAAVSNAQLEQKADNALQKAKLALADALLEQSEGKVDFKSASNKHNNAVADAAQDINKIQDDMRKRAAALDQTTGQKANPVGQAVGKAQPDGGGNVGASNGQPGLTINMPLTINGKNGMDPSEVDAIVNQVITKLKDTLTRTSKKSA